MVLVVMMKEQVSAGKALLLIGDRSLMSRHTFDGKLHAMCLVHRLVEDMCEMQ